MGILTLQAAEPIKLPAPDLSRSTTLSTALQQRKSVREFSDRQVTMQDLSDLLWSADGINREDGKRTAPSAMNKQRIAIYVLTTQAAYRYDHKEHSLVPVFEGDVRQGVRGTVAPLCLVLVNEGDDDRWTGVDTGYISQNIYLFCAANSMATVACGGMDRDKVAAAIGVTEKDRLIIQHPVGYAK